jgi:hypothetical protein
VFAQTCCKVSHHYLRLTEIRNLGTPYLQTGAVHQTTTYTIHGETRRNFVSDKNMSPPPRCSRRVIGVLGSSCLIGDLHRRVGLASMA